MLRVLLPGGHWRPVRRRVASRPESGGPVGHAECRRRGRLPGRGGAEPDGGAAVAGGGEAAAAAPHARRAAHAGAARRVVRVQGHVRASPGRGWVGGLGGGG